MSEQNKTDFRRFVDEVINNGNVDAVDEFIAEDFTEHNPIPGMEDLSGREAMKQMVGIFMSSFSDLKATINELIAEDDKVVGIMTTTGTHTGELATT
jgi:predicted ester cyclase